MIISYNHSIDPVLPQIQERMNYYGIRSYPTVVFDGTDIVAIDNPPVPYETTYYTVYNAHINTMKSFTPSYNLKLIGSASPTNGSLHITIYPADTLRHSSVYAFVALCEDSVRGNVGGRFNYVIRQLSSFPINLFYPDSLDTTITFSHSIPVDKMRAVLFIQNSYTKKILQAIKTKF